jgi:small conductance mechanosensitive channel
MEYWEKLKVFFIERGLILFLALAVLVAGLIISRLARRWIKAILNRSRIRDDQLLKSFFLRTTSFSIIIISVLAALGTVGFDVRAFLAGLGITGLILGFGLRDTLSNFAAGLLLLIYRPFRAGELIEVEGSQGVVEELTIVNMQMTTTDGVRVIMPNSKVWGAKITNFSLSDRRRVEASIRVGDEDIDNATQAIKQALAVDRRVLDTPSPTVQVTSITDNTATLTLQAWTLPTNFQDISATLLITMQAALRSVEIRIL